MDQALLRCDQRQCDEAISLLEKANRIVPSDPAIYFHLGFCHSGGCNQHPLVDLGLADAYLRRALLLVGTGSDRLLRAKILNALGNVCSRSAADAAQLRQAIEYHDEAAKLYAGIGQRDAWAREEFNQAGIWCDLPQGQFPDKWARAIEHYENALRIRTRTHDRQAYASAMMNLGTAWRQLPTGDKQQNVLKAIRCYRRAWRIYKSQTSGTQFAELSNNLGNACTSYPGRDGLTAARHARYAVRHFERALEIWNGDEYGFYNALAQYNLGCAHLKLLSSGGHRGLAITCFAAAAESAKSCGHKEVEQLAGAQLQALTSGETSLQECDKPLCTASSGPGRCQ